MAARDRTTRGAERDLPLELTILLALGTGAMHVAIAVEYASAGLVESAARFAGIAGAFGVGAALVALDVARQPIIRAGIPFTAFVIGAWVLIGERNLFAYATKLIELALILVLAVLVYRHERAEG